MLDKILKDLRETLLFDCVRNSNNQLEMNAKASPLVKSIGVSINLEKATNLAQKQDNKDFPYITIVNRRTDFLERESAYYFWNRHLYDIYTFAKLTDDRDLLGYKAVKEVDAIRNKIQFAIQGRKYDKNQSPVLLYDAEYELVEATLVIHRTTMAIEVRESYVGMGVEVQPCELIDEWDIDLTAKHNKVDETKDENAIIPLVQEVRQSVEFVIIKIVEKILR